MIAIRPTGLSLAHPFSSGIARQLRGTSGIYGIIDQQIYRPEGGDPESGISVFSRISATPSDRNLMNFFWMAELCSPACCPAGPTISSAHPSSTRISDRARALDRDMIA